MVLFSEEDLVRLWLWLPFSLPAFWVGEFLYRLDDFWLGVGLLRYRLLLLALALAVALLLLLLLLVTLLVCLSRVLLLAFALAPALLDSF